MAADGTIKIGAEVDSASAKKELDALGKSAEGSSSKIADGFKLAAGAIAAIGTALAAIKLGDFVKDVIDTGKQFDTSMSQVQATMGITKDHMSELDGQSVNTMDALGNLAKEMGSSTAFSASQCAEALNYLALSGMDTQEMADTLPHTLNLAAAGGLDLARASDMLTDSMSALGLDTSDAEKMVDQMAKTASKSNTSVGQLGDAMLTIGASARSVKGGTAELSTALGILANNGIKGAEGGTHLRNIIMSLQTPTDQAKDALTNLGVSVYDSEGHMRSMNDVLGDLNTSMEGMTDEEKANIISKIFNKTDMAAVNALLGSTGDEWDELQQSIIDSAGAAQEMADTQLDNLEGQLTILGSALEGFKLSLWENMRDPLTDLAKVGINAITELTEAFNDNGLSGLITCGARIITNLLTGIAQEMPNVMAKGTEIISNIIDAVIENAPQVISAAADTIASFISGIGQALPTLIPKGLEMIITIVNSITDNIPKIVQAGVDLLKGLVQGIINAMPDLIAKAPEAINNFSNAIYNGLATILQTGVKLIGELAKGIKQNMPLIKENALAIFNAVLNVFTLSKLTSLGKSLMTNLGSGIKGMMSSVGSTAKSVGQNALNMIKNINWSNLGQSIIKLIVSGLKGVASNLGTALKSAGTTAMSAIKNISWSSVGSAIIQGIKSGIVGAAKGLASAAVDAAKGALNSVKSALGIHSPSRVFRDEVGKMEIKGIEVAWDDGADGMADKAMRAMEAMKKRIGNVDLSAVFSEIKLPDLNIVDWYNRFTDGKFAIPQPQTDFQNLKTTINTDELKDTTKNAILEGMSKVKVWLDGEPTGKLLTPYIDKNMPVPEF